MLSACDSLKGEMTATLRGRRAAGLRARVRVCFPVGVSRLHLWQRSCATMLAMPMNTETARALCDITSAFYRDNAVSFSSTRHSAWVGWERALDQAGFTMNKPPAHVLDVACGNMRFLDFLETRYPGCSFDYRAVDNCPALAGGVELGEAPGADDSAAMPKRASTVHFTGIDIAGALLEEGRRHALAAAFRGDPLADLAVCFGFFHHVPTMPAREELLRALVSGVRPGGAIIVSLWQFANNPDLARRARETDARARVELGLPQLDSGDYLLGWQNKPGAYRYCHSFTRQEADALVASVEGEAEPVARFEADGRTGNLNAYLVLRRASLPARNDPEPTGRVAGARLHAYKGS